MTKVEKKVGLALGGGGARGLAHIGVLRVFEQAGIPVDLIAGTSFGGFIGAAYAIGRTPDEIKTITDAYSTVTSWLRVIDIRGRGLISEARIDAFFNGALGVSSTFNDLKIPLCVTATDLHTGEEVLLQSGSLLDAMRATTAVPGILPPGAIGRRIFVDGAVLNNLPVDVPQKMGADLVIGIDTTQTITDLDASNQQSARHLGLVPKSVRLGLRDMERSRVMMMRRLIQMRTELAQPDLIIKPDFPEGVTLFNGFDRADQIVALGEEAAHAALPQIEALLDSQPLPKANTQRDQDGYLAAWD